MLKAEFRLTLLLLTLFVCRSVAEDSAISRVFTEMQVTGTMVLSSLDGKTEYRHDDSRARQRLVPASTFKIPNTLIALEEQAIRTDSEVIRWDGVMRDVPAWNRDQTLRTAFQSSCVWAYQELAKRIGPATYKRYLEKIGYGNAEVGDSVTTFWLAGPLKISATEQVEVLRKMLTRQLPFHGRNIDAVKSIMIADSSDDYVLRCKTGWAASTSPQIGWFVGYVETKQRVWLFATNIDIEKPSDLGLRKAVTIAALKAKGIL